ncbi:cytochrome P450 [Pisolithus sp. B1]|nr:cytochrome P450 [Pisolithus sp. B1]
MSHTTGRHTLEDYRLRDPETMVIPFLPAGAACVTAIGLWLAIRIASKRSGLPYPPGPKRLPIIGNAFDIDLKEPHVTYTKWANIYGDIVYSRIFGQDIVIVNSERMARLLADQRSSIYSDRPHSPIYRLFGTHHMTPVLEYGKEWKTQRKLLHLSLRQDVIDRYQELHLRSAHELLKNIQQDSKNFYDHFDLYTGSVALEFTYGRKVNGRNDPIITMAAGLAGIMGKGITSERVGLLTALPILEYVPSWFPGASFQDEARTCRDLVTSFSDYPFSIAKRQAQEAGGLLPSFISDMLGQGEVEESDAKETATGIYIAAAETTSSTLKVLVLAMILNPEIQKKVHAELDAVIGKGVLPTFEDRERLPYLQAVLYEVMRWHPALPLGIPHATTANDIVDGYYIPKGLSIVLLDVAYGDGYFDIAGTLVIFNTWSMANNEYNSPERFDPTRYLTADGKLKPDAKQDNSKFFGFGRRKPKMPLARRSRWCPFFGMAWLGEYNALGNSAIADLQVAISHPAPYQCSIVSRTSNEREGG